MHSTNTIQLLIDFKVSVFQKCFVYFAIEMYSKYAIKNNNLNTCFKVFFTRLRTRLEHWLTIDLRKQFHKISCHSNIPIEFFLRIFT